MRKIRRWGAWLLLIIPLALNAQQRTEKLLNVPLPGYVLYDCGQVTGSDEQFGCIKRYFTLGGTMFMNQLDETFEYLFLTIYSFGLFLQEQVLGLVIEVQNEVLNEIFEDLNAETIIPVFIKIFHDQAEPDEWFYTFFRDDNAWMLF